MRGSLARGSIRMICGGRNAHSNRSKRGAKSVTRRLSPCRRDRLDNRRIAHIVRLCMSESSEGDVAEPLYFTPGQEVRPDQMLAGTAALTAPLFTVAELSSV